MSCQDVNGAKPIGNEAYYRYHSVAGMFSVSSSGPYMDKLPSGNNVNSMVGKFEKLFVKEIVGFTEKNYRVRKDKAHRAIAGLSMGGLHALFVSLNHPQLLQPFGQPWISLHLCVVRRRTFMGELAQVSCGFPAAHLLSLMQIPPPAQFPDSFREKPVKSFLYSIYFAYLCRKLNKQR